MTKKERIAADQERVDGMYVFQKSLEEGYTGIFGIDEVGRGPLCGPVVAACVLLPEEKIYGLNDSKKLTEKKREELVPLIKEKAITYGIGSASPERIDEINILNATFEAMKEAYEQAVNRLKEKNPALAEKLPQFLILVDGNKTVPGIAGKQLAVVGGDAKCPSISAASILAKVTRDHMMIEYDKTWPQYGFAQHKGYGTEKHYAALKEYGPCPIHRKTYL